MSNVFPEPVWTTPQDVDGSCSYFSLRGPTPFALTGVFLRLLQYHFSDPNNIEEEALKGYIWTPSLNACQPSTQMSETGETVTVPGSRLIIRPSWSQDTSATQQLPGIFVKREPVRTARVSLRDRSTTSLNENGVFEGEQMNMQFTGAHSIICRGMTGGEADLLAHEVFFRMLHYQQVIKADFGLGHLMTAGVSEVRQRTDEARSTFYAVVSMEWAYIYRWLVTQESPIVKRMVVAQM